MAFDILGAREAGYSDDEIAQFLAPQRKFDLDGALKSGYTTSEIVDQWATPERPTSAVGEVGKGLVRGFVSSLPEMAGKAAQFSGEAGKNEQPGSTAYEVGTSLRNVAEDYANKPSLKASPEGHGIINNAFTQGAEMIGPSVAAMGSMFIPGMQGVGGMALASTLSGTLFGASQAQDTYEKGIKAGLSPADANSAAWKTGGIEALGETAGTFALGRLFGVAGKIVGKTAGAGVESVFSAYKDPGVMKSFIKALGTTYGVEIGTEMGQNAGEAAVEQAAGIPTASPWEAAKQAIGPTAAMTTLLAPLGIAGHIRKGGSQTFIAGAIEGADNAPQLRTLAAKQIADSLHEVDPEFEKQWSSYAEQQIRDGAPIVLGAEAIRPGADPLAVVSTVLDAQSYDEGIAAAEAALDAPIVPTATPATVETIGTIPEAAPTTTPVDGMSIKALEYAARLTRSETRRAEISAEIERRASLVAGTNQAESVSQPLTPVSQPLTPELGTPVPNVGMEVPNAPLEAPGALTAVQPAPVPAQTAAPAAHPEAPQAIVAPVDAGTVAKPRGLPLSTEVSQQSVAEKAPIVAAEATPVQESQALTPREQPAPVNTPAVQAAESVQLEDFTRRRDSKVMSFGTSAQAAAYAKQRTNGVAGNYVPRREARGQWVLSRPAKVVTPEQRAAASARAAQVQKGRTTVRSTDDVLKVISKSGGWNTEDALKDGVDPADIKAKRNAGAFGAPVFRKNGGRSIDGIAEVLAQEGFDVLDEAGRFDATKAREIVHQALMGDKVYSPRGQEILAATAPQEDRRAFEPDEAELSKAELGKEDATSAAIVHQALDIDEGHVEALAIQYGDDEAGFIRAVEEFVNDQSNETVAGRQARAQAPASAEAANAPDLKTALAQIAEVAAEIRNSKPQEVGPALGRLDDARHAAEKAGATALQVIRAMEVERRPMGAESSGAVRGPAIAAGQSQSNVATQGGVNASARPEVQSNTAAEEQLAARDDGLARQARSIARAEPHAALRPQGGNEVGRDAGANVQPPGALRDQTQVTKPRERGLSVSDLRAKLDPIVSGWANGPDLQVLATFEDAPKAVQAKNQSQLAQGAEGKPYAFFHEGTAYVIADEVTSMEQAVEGLFHEALGHYGLRGVFGAQLEPMLTQIVIGRREEVAAKAKAYGLDMGKKTDRLMAAEEILAEMAQTRPESGLVTRVVAAIRNFLREQGIDIKWSDADIIQKFILPARRFVERGNGKDGMAGATFAREGVESPTGGKDGFWQRLKRGEYDRLRVGQGDGRVDRGSLGKRLAAAYGLEDRGGWRTGRVVGYRANGGGQEALLWNGSLAGSSSYYTVARWVGDDLHMSVIPLELTRGMDLADVYRNADDLAFMTIGLTKRGEKYELGVSDPEPGTRAYRLLDERKRLIPTGRTSAQDHKYNRIRFDTRDDGMKPLIAEAFRRFGVGRGFAPHVFSPGRDTGANMERQRDYTPATVEAKFARSKPAWVESGNAALKSAAGKIDTYAPDKTIKEKFQELSENWADRAVKEVFDPYVALKKLTPNGYILARMVKSADTSLEATLRFGMPVLNDDGSISGTLDTKGFLGHMSELNGEHDRFFMWVAGNRSERLMTEGREHLFSAAEIQAMKNLIREQGPADKWKGEGTRPQAYAKAAAALRAYNSAFMDIAEKTGEINGESRKIWEHDFYVPYFRMDEDMKIAGPSRVNGLARNEVLKTLKGGTEPLGDLLDNTIRNWQHILSASLANQAAKTALKAAVDIGVAVEADEATAKQLEKAGGPTAGATYVMDGGEKHWYTVGDPFVLEAISSLETPSINWLGMKTLRSFKRALTTGVTAAPPFRVRNLIRDSSTAIAQNQMSYNLVKNVWEGYKHTNPKSAPYAQAMFGGGIIRFGNIDDGTHAEHAKRLILAGVKDQTILDTQEKVRDAIGKLWDVYQENGDRFENVNRMSLIEQRKAAGATNLEAMFAGRDSMDFTLVGANKAVRFLTQVVPFMNARLQGLYKTGRAVREDPKRVAYVTGALTLASIALMLAYKDDDEWKKRADWDRDTYFWFKIGDTAFRIPKGFELGGLASLAERGLEYFLSDEMNGKRFAERLWFFVGNTLSLNPIPQLAKPMVDIYANTDSFTGRQIETRGMENLTKPERIGRRTTLVAQTLGKAGNITQLSPVQIDHLIQAYLGWLGTHAAMTADVIAEPFLEVSKPSRKIGDLFVIGDFVKDLPSSQSRYVEDFYKQAKNIHEVMGDLKQARDTMNAEKVRKILEDNHDEVMLHTLYSSVERSMTDINHKIKVIERSSIDADEKRARIDEMNDRKNRLAQLISKRTLELQSVAQ